MMTPLIHSQYEKLKMLCDMLSPTLFVFPNDELEKMVEDFRPWANGTLGIIAMQKMGVEDLQKSEENLSNAIKIAENILALKKLLNIGETHA
jgi:hypothetical protein